MDNEIRQIKIRIPFVNEYGPQESHFEGFLTTPRSAMFMEESRTLTFLTVEATEVPDVYLATSGELFLGKVSDPDRELEVIESLSARLKEMTAYDLMEQVLVHVRTMIEFEDLLVN